MSAVLPPMAEVFQLHISYDARPCCVFMLPTIFEYSFVDHVIKGYSGQDHVQVAYIIQLAVDTVQDLHPAAKKASLIQIAQVVFPHNN